MRSNSVKAALRHGKSVVGSEVSRFRSAEVPLVYAQAGFDFVFIDMEHSAFGLETVADLVRTSRSVDLVPIVRVPQAEYAYVARVLDCGAQGVIVPRVNTPELVREIVSWMRYPPEGIRGYACTSRQTDDQPVATAAFLEAARNETLCVIQIERRQALEHLDEMLAVPGVDVACLGYMDLSVDLGIPGQLDHPRMIEAIERIITVANRNQVAPGIICPDLDAVLTWVSRGMRFVSYSTEAMLLAQAASAAIRQLRSAGLPGPLNGDGGAHASLRRGRA
jgi:2-keto-3-deoxy-L-rhamnonate aldolase RhmA